MRCILNVEGNNLCCDCGAPDPDWASVNLGITLCIGKLELKRISPLRLRAFHNSSSILECSGIHRSLGVHYSKVKSLKLDSWEPGLLKVMGELGNNLVNRIYLAKADVVHSLGLARATPTCSRSAISQNI